MFTAVNITGGTAKEKKETGDPVLGRPQTQGHIMHQQEPD